MKSNPDEIKINQQEDIDEMACSAEFSQGCIDPVDDQK